MSIHLVVKIIYYLSAVSTVAISVVCYVAFFTGGSVFFKKRSRLAKLTPKKKGYFVAFWEKDTKGINQAYSYENSPEKLIVSVIDNERRGQFIFPKKALLKYGILKSPKQKGKMALRVYPSWVTELNTNAAKTQTWQVEYFIDLSDAIDVDKLKKLYFL